MARLARSRVRQLFYGVDDRRQDKTQRDQHGPNPPEVTVYLDRISSRLYCVEMVARRDLTGIGG
jgi:hypothetical protein